MRFQGNGFASLAQKLLSCKDLRHGTLSERELHGT